MTSGVKSTLVASIEAPMPYVPYSEVDPSTGRFPDSSPSGGLLNGVTQPMCAAYNELSQWTQAAFSAAGANTGPARWLSTRPIYEFLCEPYGGVQTDSPPFPGIPDMPQACHTYGSCTWRSAIYPEITDDGWAYGEFTWDCNSQFLNPTGGWQWFVDAGGNGYWRLPFNSTGGSTIYVTCGGNLGEQDRRRIQVLSFSCNYCPSCNLPPVIQPPPVVPPPVVVVDPAEPPIINVDIHFPRGWGLPDIIQTVSYSPVINNNVDVDVQPSLTLAPRVDISPSFQYAPTFEFSLGGVSIGGGGYPESRTQTQDMQECDCPDPCPPVADVDYPRIQRIVEAVATTFRTLPGREESAFSGSATQSGESVEHQLSPGARYVNYNFDLTNYKGGDTAGTGSAPSVFYPGWVFFGRGGSRDYAGERMFLNTQSGFIPIPPFAKTCYIQCVDGATVSSRVWSLPDLPNEVL